jgi:photosystem II stability/assembly factor-like uncharacterized protein
MSRLTVLSLIIFYLLPPGNSIAQTEREEWRQIPSPTDKTLRNLYFIDAQTGWVAGEDGTIIHTSNGGDDWIVQNSNVHTFIVDIFFINENIGWAITFKDTFPFGSIILNTKNGGDNWIAEDYPDGNVFMNTIFFFDTLNGWIGGTYIAGTTNGGITWVEAEVDSSMISGLPVYNFNFYNLQFGYACGGYLDLAGVIWRTTNYGENWTATGVSPDQVFDIYIIDSLNVITLSGDPEGFWGIGDIKTTDAGTSWTYEELSLSGLSFAIDFRTETEGWSASGFKFLFTSDKGESWIDKETPDSAIIFDLVFTDSITGYAVGEMGTILKYKKDSETPADSIPYEIKLFQNFPNPFSVSTQIEWQLPIGNFVTLKLFDMLGNEISTLINEFQDAGYYSKFISFNPALSSGIYFYQFISGSYVSTKKMIHLK